VNNLLQSRSFPISELVVARFNAGDDVLLSIKEVAEKHKVTSGMFSLIGALDRAEWGFYSPQKRTYLIKKWGSSFLTGRAREILSCVGNVGQLDGKIVVHGHIVMKSLSDHARGGHLLEGCRVFPTAELTLLKASGTLTREQDDRFGLALLSFK
jgi:predicted DNA-binding protein with PD1-like motif